VKEKNSSICSDGSTMSDPFQFLPNILARASFVEKIHLSLISPKINNKTKLK
jgi:hypothetical protein